MFLWVSNPIIFLHFDLQPRMLSILKEKKIHFSSQEKGKIEADLPNLRPLKMSIGNKNWHGKEHFFSNL